MRALEPRYEPSTRPCPTTGCTSLLAPDEVWCARCRLTGRHLPRLSNEQSGMLLAERLAYMQMSQRDVARAMGVKPSAVCQWVNGVRPPSPEMRPALARALDLTE